MSQQPPPTGGPADGPGPVPPPPPPTSPAPLPSFTTYAGPVVRDNMPPPMDKGLGWTGFWLSLVVCAPLLPLVGAVLAIIALARGRFRPRAAAVLAIVIGVLSTLGQVALLPSILDGALDAADEQLEREADAARESGERREISILKLRRGDCFDSAMLSGLTPGTTEDSTTVTLVPCESAHDLEVFRILELPEGDYPGQATIDERAARCTTHFEDFVGRSYGTSRFEVYYLFPREESWRLLGDRTITCIAGHPRKKVVGSLRGRDR